MSMAPVTTQRATLDDLYRTEGKAELIGGRIVKYMPSGYLPGRVAFRIARSLDDYAVQLGRGVATTDGVGYAVPELPSGRESFSPDAAFHLGNLPANLMRFIEGAPTFAVEVRSENDHGDAAEADMAAKRADYFAAGTEVVWDVDPVAKQIHAYRRAAPTQPVTFGPGQAANAEPAVPGWTVAVDWVFA
jgi:Uma2 family endonuclease